MSNKLNQNSLQIVNLKSYHRNRALKMMQVYESEENEPFFLWLNRFEYVADYIGVSRDEIVEFFFALVDNKNHEQVRENCPDVNLTEQPYELLINYYIQYLLFTDELKIHRNRFCNRNQYEQEPIENYSRNLWKIYNMCGFQCDIDYILCQRFRNGIRDDDIKTHLFKAPDLSFKDTVARAIEFAKNNLIMYYVDQALLKIDTYNPNNKRKFHIWLNKFEYVADITGVPDNKMIEFFLLMVDSDLHLRVKKTFSNLNYTEFLYDEIINYYIRYFSLYDVYLHRNRLHHRYQYEQEPLERYVNSLRKIYNKCSYTGHEEELLCKQFINGIRYNEVRIHLYQNPCLPFDETVAKAIQFAKDNLVTYYLDHAFLYIHIYHLQDGSFFAWFNKFEYIIDKIKVPDNKIIEFFYQMVHNEVHMEVMNSFPTVNFSKLSYENIINNYLKKFSFPDESHLHRRRFIFRNQYEEETIDEYAKNLLKIYNKCDYIDFQDERLSGKFLYGIRDKEIKRYLKQISNLTFNKAIGKAIAFEMKKKKKSKSD
ncbi:hypothetical protein M0804_013253 [Polistes exclamans]|nr:hypothetical protein M0804_013253 [Polistes exclamans]